jgi:hypothetical protein
MRIANIREEGSVGFREGETIVMPNTNVEVHVVEAGDDKIVLEEGGSLFTWIPGEVGWVLDPSVHPQAYAKATPPGVTVHFPEQEGEGQSETPGADDELGPEVPPEEGE